MDVTLKLNSLDVSSILSAYQVVKEVTYQKIITTMDNVEHPIPAPDRTLVRFSLFPMTDEGAAALYDVLALRTVSVTYTDPYIGEELVKNMRLNSSLEAAFGLKSVDGNRYYKGGTIEMRQN